MNHFSETPNPFKEYSDFLQKLKEGMENLCQIDEVEIATAPKSEVFSTDRVKLYRYRATQPEVHHRPLLMVYALVNRNTMLDLQENRSLIRNLLNQGLDVYLIDWGYPKRSDRYLTMEDHIDGYLNDCVDFIRESSGKDRVNMLGICQGGTFSTIYSCLNQDKIHSLITTVTPVDFDHEESLLNLWCQNMDVDALVEAQGNVSGNFMNSGFQSMKPVMLNFRKYLDLVETMGDRKKLEDFLRMEKWIFDSPDQPGETFRKFIKELYQQNKLVKGEFELGGRRVDLRELKIPLMVVYAEHDHLVPPCSAKPLYELAGSEEKKLVSFPVGHIGLYVSGKTQKALSPAIAEWLREQD